MSNMCDMRLVWRAWLAEIALVLTSLVALGCTGPTFIVQEYAGPVRPPESIAILRFEGSGTAQLISLDGERADVRVPSDARLHVEVLPGKHALMVQNVTTPHDPPQAVAFQAESGKTYQPLFVNRDPSRAFATLRIYQIDRKTSAPLADATLDRAEPEGPDTKPPRVTPPANSNQQTTGATNPASETQPNHPEAPSKSPGSNGPSSQSHRSEDPSSEIQSSSEGPNDAGF